MSVRTPFKVGKKELFLPMVNITLRRTPYLEPNYANFQVPLFFSKLDLRDYLWHVYGVQTGMIRSVVRQSPVQSTSPRDIRPIRRWHRPRARKFMTVQLARPFVWPEEPGEEELKAWNKKEVEMNEKEQKKVNEAKGPTKDTFVNEERRVRMREQAQLLLDKKVKWVPGKSLGE